MLTSRDALLLLNRDRKRSFSLKNIFQHFSRGTATLTPKTFRGTKFQTLFCPNVNPSKILSGPKFFPANIFRNSFLFICCNFYGMSYEKHHFITKYKNESFSYLLNSVLMIFFHLFKLSQSLCSLSKRTDEAFLANMSWFWKWNVFWSENFS